MQNITRGLLTCNANSETGSFPHTGRFMTTCEILRVVCEHLCWVCTKPDLAVTYDPNGIYPQKSQALPFRLGCLPFLKSKSTIQNSNGKPAPRGHAGLRAKQTRNRTRTWNVNRQEPDCPASQQRRILHRHLSSHVLVLSKGCS